MLRGGHALGTAAVCARAADWAALLAVRLHGAGMLCYKAGAQFICQAGLHWRCSAVHGTGLMLKTLSIEAVRH